MAGMPKTAKAAKKMTSYGTGPKNSGKPSSSGIKINSPAKKFMDGSKPKKHP